MSAFPQYLSGISFLFLQDHLSIRYDIEFLEGTGYIAQEGGSSYWSDFSVVLGYR